MNCEACESGFNEINPAVIYCYNCYVHLCQDCSDYLHALEGFLNHILYTKNDVRIRTTVDQVLAFRHRRKSTRKSRKSLKVNNKEKKAKTSKKSKRTKKS
jgi:hypothetical protein